MKQTNELANHAAQNIARRDKVVNAPSLEPESCASGKSNRKLKGLKSTKSGTQGSNAGISFLSINSHIFALIDIFSPSWCDADLLYGLWFLLADAPPNGLNLSNGCRYDSSLGKF